MSEVQNQIALEEQRQSPPGKRPYLQFHDVQQQLSVIKEGIPSEQHNSSPSLDQEDPQHLQIKEEPEEAIITKLFSLVPVKSEDEEEKSLSLEFHRSQTEKNSVSVGDPETDPEYPRRHMKSHTEGKPDSCSVCSKSLRWKTCLEEHTRTHMEQRPFSCSVCDLSFSQGACLRRHMKIHMGEKPFRCSFCEVTCTTKYSLLEHMKIHTGEKPFSCDGCSKKFAWLSGAKAHQKRCPAVTSRARCLNIVVIPTLQKTQSEPLNSLKNPTVNHPVETHSATAVAGPNSCNVSASSKLSFPVIFFLS
ncbi:zinc finger protein 271-like [Melanotaenia boesemani]|uniref:zinc finger protein 271-like n=1 Tax=Melanotaenia boesemani TaxID=1250792 RepID=UPI001C050DFB|nr:zinc finger protein 271-like [Melanotaenia boesemani]